MNTEHTELHRLTALFADEAAVRLYFPSLETMLAARAAIVREHPDVKLETAERDISVMFTDPADASEFVGLYLGAMSAPHEDLMEEDSTEGQLTRGEELELLLRQPNGITLDELAERWNVKRESAAATLSVQSRKRHLNVVRDHGRYRVAA